jgi:hypothetical protein
MASLKNMMPDKRRTTVLLTLLFLLALFMIPYFFVFIPANAENLKRQAFLKLNRAAQNMIERTNDTRHYFVNNKSGADTLYPEESKIVDCGSGTTGISKLDSVYFKDLGSEGWNILFAQEIVDTVIIKHHDTIKKRFTLAHSKLLEPFVSPCLASGKEVFSSFLLIHYCQHTGRDTSGKIIYQDFREGMEQDINLDSLVPRHLGIRSPDIQDISLEGTEYKLFSYPFQLDRHRLIICGLLKSETYYSQIHVIPIGIFYTLVICLTLFLFCIPFLKIFMMNARDRIYASNLINGAVFLFAMASFITIIITQLILLWQGRTQVNINLETLSSRLADSLSGELRQAQEELSYFDGRLNKYFNDSSGTKKSSLDTPYFIIMRDSAIHDKARMNDRILSGHIPAYHNSDHIFWVNDTGQESVRIRYIDSNLVKKIDSNAVVDSIPFANLKARQYYRDMSRFRKYGRDTCSLLMLAPVHSWASGEFRVNICRLSSVKGLLMNAMETRLYSLVNTVLPTGYGYCLINDRGNVLIHSDSLKSLRENFIEETGNLPWILGAIRGRQQNQFTNVAFYGASNTLRIQPLKQHPLFLAVFYNNDYLQPENLRILTFSIFFSLITYGLLFLLFRILYKVDPETCVYSPMDYYSRMIPLQDKINMYFNGSLFLLIYILMLMIAAVLSPYIGNDFDYSMLVFGLLSPFNLLYVLWLLRHRKGESSSQESFRHTGPILLTGIMIYLISYLTGWRLELFSFWIMEFLLILFLYIIILKKGRPWLWFSNTVEILVKGISKWNNKTPEQKKLFSFSAFVTLFIIAIAVLPSLEYTWFAYNHEFRQSIKKEQLEIADGLQKRERNIRSFLRSHQPDFTGKDKYFDMLQYKEGIYPFYVDSIKYLADSISSLPAGMVSRERNDFLRRKEGDHDSLSESFYLSIANTINFYYNDPANLPPLWDSSINDNLWHWDQGKYTSEFDYARPKWKIPPFLSDTISPEIRLKIYSSIPPGFKLETHLKFVFAGMVLLLILSIYRITKSITRQVYLTKIVADAGSGLKDHFGNEQTGIWEKCLNEKQSQSETQENWSSSSELILDLTAEYDDFANAEAKDLVSRESAIISRSQELRPVFECVWKKLDDKEKYLLYCLANDGLINHKNESLVYSLLHKKLLVIFDQRIRLVSYSFRDFIISRNNTAEEVILLKKMQSEASWGSIRTILLVVIMSVFIFLFLTQQEVSTKIIALVTSLSALLPFILKFGSRTPAVDEKK